jgi:predicted NBD/HSP70 family sugar kinase
MHPKRYIHYSHHYGETVVTFYHVDGSGEIIQRRQYKHPTQYSLDRLSEYINDHSQKTRLHLAVYPTLTALFPAKG